MTVVNKMRKVFSSKEYFAHIEIPDTWETIEDFTNWYLDAKLPLMIPWNAKIICSDDATAVCLFRKGAFQVELYLVHPQQYVPLHEHPDMEVITMFLGGGDPSKIKPPVPDDTAFNLHEGWGVMAPKLEVGEAHGGHIATIDKNGYVLLAFQRWDNGNPLSAAVQWKGDTAGPKQEKMIREAYPDAYIEPGWANIKGEKKS